MMSLARTLTVSVLVSPGLFVCAHASMRAQTQPSTQPAAANVPLPTRLTHVVHAYANFAPDDQTVVFQSNATGKWDLYTMRADGTGVRQITANPAAEQPSDSTSRRG